MMTVILWFRYAAISAENGQAALDILRRFPERVSFVLVDIVMPVMNGVELLHVIKVSHKS